MELHRPIVIPALLAAAALVLAGCSGGDDGTEPDLPQGPITQRMAELERQMDGDADAAMVAALEESVAACMKQQGFDYTPRTRDHLVQDADMPDWGSQEYAKTYGYGVSTWQNLPTAGAAETYTDDSEPGAQDAAYQEALYGAPSDELFDDQPSDGDLAAMLPGGCYGEAIAQIGLTELMTSTVTQDLVGLDKQVDEDAKVIAALDQWSTCMADKGYSFKTPDDAEASFYDRLYTKDGTLVDGDELKALQDEEIATAVADHKCSENVERVRATVLTRLETDYYADHKTEVEAYFAQVEKFAGRG